MIFKVIETAYIEGIVLVMLGGFIAHWVLAHSIHDMYHIDIEDRVTLSKKTLKALLIISAFILLSIAIYLTIQCGWPVIVFAIIGAVVCLYLKDLFHHELQIAFGSMFLVLGGFYVQVGTLNINSIIWIKIICLAVFAFLSQYG